MRKYVYLIATFTCNLLLSYCLSGHYSVVSIELKQEATGAKLSLLQTEVPEAECERTKEGWRRYIFEAIKTTFGFGAHLF